MFSKISTFSGIENIYHECHQLLKGFINQKPEYKGFVALDYKKRTRFDNPNLIPFVFYKNIIIFKYLDTFQQNNIILAKKIRSYIVNYCVINNLNKVTAIGGESYAYLKMIKGIEEYNFYCNQKKLKEEADFNLIDSNNLIIDYNDKKLKLNLNSTLIINLSKLNHNLMNVINKNLNVNKIIIINCHHSDFWKKMKILNNFRIVERNQYVDYNYFITVSILTRI